MQRQARTPIERMKKEGSLIPYRGMKREWRTELYTYFGL